MIYLLKVFQLLYVRVLIQERLLLFYKIFREYSFYFSQKVIFRPFQKHFLIPDPSLQVPFYDIVMTNGIHSHLFTRKQV